jgi:hypothetical protein
MDRTELPDADQSDERRTEFEATSKGLVTAAEEQGLILRLLGSLAFQMHCSQYGYIQKQLGRAYTDIDYASYHTQSSQMSNFFKAQGFIEDAEVNLYFAGQRLIFHHPSLKLHVDVFFDKLDFCHEIVWNGRLEKDSPTIPLAELLLEKMQIVRINEKDVIDTIMLLLEHPLGEHDRETINIALISQLCSHDWGLWRTVTMNLEKVGQLAQNYPQLNLEEKSRVRAQVDQALDRIHSAPKTMNWKLRSKLGDKVKWYKDVEEVS